MTRFRAVIFRFFEQRILRDWFYTIAFVIFVPVGFRFAILAWRFGSWIDKPLAMLAGAAIGVTAVVTLTRFWHVPPTPIVTMEIAEPEPKQTTERRSAQEYLSIARRRAAENRALALGAGALGSSTRRNW